MAKGKTLKVVLKADNQRQAMLLPPGLNDLVAANHPVRIANEVLDKIDITALVKMYKPGGTSSYHPRMLLKVLIYAYINNVYSSRKIEEAVSQNINYMWLSGMSTPDHNTINRFRGKRLQQALKPIFNQVVSLLCEQGLLDIRDLYTDGTKIEASANRYSFVWGKAIKTSKERITQQLKELWQHAQSVAASELDDTDPSGFDKIDKHKVDQAIQAINEALKDKPVSKEVRQKSSYAKKNWPAALDKYEQQEKIMGRGRNSYSKTDTDATFMRMKEGHMRNGQLKPAYNVQISTNNQYIASYSIHQNTTDTNTLTSHISQHIKEYKVNPSTITADAGYGSEQNYQWLENKRITAYVKHNQFDRRQNKKIQEKTPYGADKLTYDEQKDIYLCPSGKAMKNIGTVKRNNRNGYGQTITHYQTKKCADCPLKQACNPNRNDRVIEVDHNLNRLKQQAEKRLKSKRGTQKRKQRCYDTEPVFANIKHNHHFKRFMLRGIEKVSVETGLLAIAHNLRKKIA